MSTNSIKTASHRSLVSLNRALLSIAIVFSYLVFAPIASAANYYVATNGSDSAPGTKSAPWKTIQNAANNVSAAGDIVHVAPGRYAYSSSNYSVIQTSRSGNASNHIRYISDTKWGAKIIGINTGSGQCVWHNKGNYVDIVGFDVTGNSAGGIYNSASYVSIIGNRVHDIPGDSGSNGGAGIDNTNYSASDNKILGNLVFNIGFTGATNTGGGYTHGIYNSNKRALISNNIILHASGYGIHNWHSGNQSTITNNLSAGNLYSGIVIGGSGGVTADNFLVTNNILVYNGRYAAEEGGSTGSNNLYKNNLSYGNKSGDFDLMYGHTDRNTLTVDPMFVNFKLDGTGNYHLKATSPAIKAGTSQGLPTTDFDGLSRNGNITIGPLTLVPPSNLRVVIFLSAGR